MRSISLSPLPLLALSLPALAAPPAVVTDIPPVHALAAQVMGDLGTPTLLLERGASAHSYQMRPADAQALQAAQLVFWIGPEMTPWLDRALGSLGGRATTVALLQAEGTFRRDFGDAAGHAHEGHDDHAADSHDDHDKPAAGDGHDHSGVDPHAWLDPANAQHWLGVIAAELSKADPENAATYAANASAAAAQIDALDATLQAQLTPVQGKPFVVFHDAYGYFASHYGLSVAGAVNLGDATAPGARHLSDLQADLSAKGVVCAFPEVQHDPKQLAMLIEGTPVKLGETLDPAGTTLTPGPALYAELLDGMATALTKCLTTG